MKVKGEEKRKEGRRVQNCCKERQPPNTGALSGLVLASLFPIMVCSSEAFVSTQAFFLVSNHFLSPSRLTPSPDKRDGVTSA